MIVLADLLREPGCSGGIIAGDFNAIFAKDHALIDEHKLVDAWVALHGTTGGPDGEGATWGVGVELEDGLKPGRLDKVVMLGLQPVEIEVLKPGVVDGYLHWSDHCGLRCTFIEANHNTRRYYLDSGTGSWDLISCWQLFTQIQGQSSENWIALISKGFLWYDLLGSDVPKSKYTHLTLIHSQTQLRMQYRSDLD